MQQLVSIICPAFNADKFIQETIDSVIKQTYTNWELIIVDDGSTDNTADIVKNNSVVDNRIKYIWQKNGKQGKARNAALKVAKGTLIAFIDSDDVWLPNKLEHQINLLNNTNADLIFGYSYLIKNNQFSVETIGKGKGIYQGNSAIELLLYHHAFIMSTILTKKSIIDSVNGFGEDEIYQYCEDWHFWLKLALNNFIFFTDCNPVMYYRLHQNSATAIEKNMHQKFFYALYDLFQKFPNQDLLINEIKIRCKYIVFHCDLNNVIVDRILQFYYDTKSLNKLSITFLKYLYKLNIYIFRKYFLFTQGE